MLLVTACTEFAPGTSSEPLPTDASVRRASSELAPGDMISLSFPGAPEMNLRQKIRANGSVNLPMVGDVQAAGRSVSSLERDLERRYESHLQNAEVVVILEQAAAAVYVSGHVLSPGKIPLDRPMTALDTIMEAGGFASTANPKKVVVVRTDQGHRKRYDLNLGDIGGGGAFYVAPYDVIHVSERRW